MMAALAQPDAFPLILLEGRIAFRKAWAMQDRSRKRTVRPKDVNWWDGYDEEFNFAHLGAREIDDEDWGKPKKKAQPKKRSAASSEIARFLELARANSKALTP